MILAFVFLRFITILGVIGLFAEYIAVPLMSEKFKFHDSTIALLDAATSCINQFILAFALAEYLVRQTLQIKPLTFQHSFLLQVIYWSCYIFS